MKDINVKKYCVKVGDREGQFGLLNCKSEEGMNYQARKFYAFECDDVIITLCTYTLDRFYDDNGADTLLLLENKVMIYSCPMCHFSDRYENLNGREIFDFSVGAVERGLDGRLNDIVISMVVLAGRWWYMNNFTLPNNRNEK